MKTFVLKLSEQHLEIIGKLLGDAPFRVAAPVVETISQQVAEQQQGARPATELPL